MVADLDVEAPYQPGHKGAPLTRNHCALQALCRCMWFEVYFRQLVCDPRRLDGYLDGFLQRGAAQRPSAVTVTSQATFFFVLLVIYGAIL